MVSVKTVYVNPKGGSMYYIFFQVSESRISEPAISVNEIPSKKLKFSVNFAAFVVWGAVEEASRRFQSLTFVQRAPVSSLTVFLYQIITQHCFVCKGLTQDLISSLRSLFPYPSFQHSVSLLEDIPFIVLTYSWYFFRKIKNTCKLSPTIWQVKGKINKTIRGNWLHLIALKYCGKFDSNRGSWRGWRNFYTSGLVEPTVV